MARLAHRHPLPLPHLRALTPLCCGFARPRSSRAGRATPPPQGWGNGRDRTQASLVDALLQIRGCLGEDAFFATLESALHQRVLAEHERAELRDRMTESARWLVDLARTDAESGLESLLRLRLHRLGLTLHTQVEIAGVGRVDFVVGDRLIVEVDGRNGHDDQPDRHKDRVRDAVASAHGFDTIRFDYDLVMHDWPTVEDAILAKIGRGLHLDPWAEQLRST